ncbi:hypothetical protein BGZ95_010776 [Linnemannia exigua]|uniref:Nudix hydrolase domain-containing protein n=1 Tax=Linnemannia exigua TaxID=604196 RepID=A0AAD4DK24_9FUNG|nr:hypothetical protein BGZ95_010776 [Linnemannia exigua]
MTTSSSQQDQNKERTPQPHDTTTTADQHHADFDLSFLPIRKIFTLIFIHDVQHNQLLLGQKQRGPLLGQWNGFGGKVEKGLESIAESAARELEEEAFLTAPLFPIGFIQWVVESAPSTTSSEPTYRDIMIVYKAHSLQPTTTAINPSSESVQHQHLHVSPEHKRNDDSNTQRMTQFPASDEMAPAWWDVDHLPWKDMRINHKVWYPFMLADRPYRGVYWYETRTSVEPGAENAQRETVKEIWVEDLRRRCFQFGDRSLSKSHGEGEGEDGRRLEMYARQLGLEGTCYLSESSTGGDVIETELIRSEPKVNQDLDGAWLRDAIAQVEKDWVATHFP